jgi:uracil-DNA glycosylase family 4
MSTLSDLEQKINTCDRCPVLVKHRNRVVPGVGTGSARIMFIGEAPGFNEDKQGEPFVGSAGSFLNELLATIGLKRPQIYITNVIKCRPPENREPLPFEIQNCRSWLDAQIALIQPKLIVTLGRFAMDAFLPGKSISKIHGQAFKIDNITYFAMYHPAAALYQQSQRDVIKNDMQKIPGLLAQAESVSVGPKSDEPRQMSLF